LACAHENQPYIIPVYLTYHLSSDGDPCFYGFTTTGQKIEWMRNNPLVCVEVEKVFAYDQWISIIATGRYEELPLLPALETGRLPAQSESCQKEHGDAGCDNEAWKFLKANPMWQEPGSTAWTVPAHRLSAEQLIPVFYRIRIDCLTGHQSSRELKDATSSLAPVPVSLANRAGNDSPRALPDGIP
jgi:hypothetical protein